MFAQNVCLAFGTILENLWKSSENHQKCHHHNVYVIKRALPLNSKIYMYLKMFVCVARHVKNIKRYV